MNKSMEQKTIEHAASQGLTLWNQIHDLIKAVNEFNQSKDHGKYHKLAGKTEGVARRMEYLLNTSANDVLLNEIGDMQAAKRAQITLDNLSIPKFGESHA